MKYFICIRIYLQTYVDIKIKHITRRHEKLFHDRNGHAKKKSIETFSIELNVCPIKTLNGYVIT